MPNMRKMNIINVRFRGAEGAPPFFSRIFFSKKVFGIVQSPQGCLCVVGLQRCYALVKMFSATSF